MPLLVDGDGGSSSVHICRPTPCMLVSPRISRSRRPSGIRPPPSIWGELIRVRHTSKHARETGKTVDAVHHISLACGGCQVTMSLLPRKAAPSSGGVVWVDRHLHKNGGSTIREVKLRHPALPGIPCHSRLHHRCHLRRARISPRPRVDPHRRRHRAFCRALYSP